MTKKEFTILYVDDEPHNLVSFKAAFRRQYTIHTAGSGKEAIERMKELDIHLVISDHRMPEMTGVQFLEKIVPDYPETLRMILTGYSDLEAIIDAINKVGIFRYVTKPWDEAELSMTIENARQVFILRRKNKKLLKELRLKVAEQESTLDLFVKYVPKEVVERGLANESASLLSAELRSIAVLFCDIRGFTAISETLNPREVVRFLNRYYSLMSESVSQHGGTVNQYIGDEVFAVFGAPKDCSDPEGMAVLCALDMRKKLDALNREFSEHFNAEIVVGISVNSGEVVAGTMGTEDRVYYSVIGDVVNTGKRIEELTKVKPNLILIHKPVYDKVCDRVEVEAWDPLPVKGKKDPLQVYELNSAVVARPE